MKPTPSASSSSNSALSVNAGCRICGDRRLELMLSLGPQPLANSFMKPGETAGEPFFPLDVYLCANCGMLQMRDVVSPEVMFRNYLYVSSTSPAFVAHFKAFAEDVFKKLGLGAKSLVVDIGSNDGILLKPFKALGTRILGVDPAENVAKIATEAGIETVCAFFSPETARKIAAEKGKASVITACNVFAHVNDLDGFLKGVLALIDEDGVFIPEFPYLVDFYEKNLFDTVYHEHLSYLAVGPLQTLFARHGLELFDAQRVSSHGGSLRLFVQRKGGRRPVSPYIGELLAKEKALKLYEAATWKDFARRVEENKRELVRLLQEIRGRGQRVLGYGAPAKGNTLLNYFGIGPTLVESIIDDSPLKQGLVTPGTHIPVVPASALECAKPDYVFILAWNFAEPIMKKLSSYKAAGGKFIVPVPKPEVV